MVLTLTAKLVISAVTLAVIGGMTATIVLVVQDAQESQPTTPGYTDTTDSTDTTGQTTEPLNLPYEVGVGIADMTGPCVEITFVSGLVH